MPAQVCANCGDPLGDSEAIRVTGRKSGNVYFVHRPSSPGVKSMCFHYTVFGADVTTISPVVRTEFDLDKAHVELAIECGLDEMACKAAGVSYAAVRAQREANRQRRISRKGR